MSGPRRAGTSRILARRIEIAVVGVCVACAGSSSSATGGAPAGPVADPGTAGATQTRTERPVIDGWIIENGLYVQPEGSPVERTVALERREDGVLWVRGTYDPGQIQATDTIDATGLYVHPAHPYSRGPLGPGQAAFLAVRTGPTPGDPAVWLIHAAEPHRLEMSENHPAGPVDERVGCYTVERGPWNDPAAAARALERLVVPADLRLHWQYLGHLDRDKYLVATDRAGNVPPMYFAHWWNALPGDSLRVTFLISLESVNFRVGRVDGGYAGRVFFGYDIPNERLVGADVRLTRVPCSEAGRDSLFRSSRPDVLAGMR